MTHADRFAAALHALEFLGVPDGRTDWGFFPAPGDYPDQLNLHNDLADLVRQRGGTVGDWYDRTSGGQQRNVEMTIGGVRVVGIETREEVGA